MWCIDFNSLFSLTPPPSRGKQQQQPDVIEDKQKDTNHLSLCMETLSKEKDISDNNLLSFKNEVKETLARMKSQHKTTLEELSEKNKIIDVALNIKQQLKAEINALSTENKTILNTHDAALREERNEANAAKNQLVQQINALTDEKELEQKTWNDHVARLKKSKQNMEEALHAKREELNSAREETNVTRQRVSWTMLFC